MISIVMSLPSSSCLGLMMAFAGLVTDAENGRAGVEFAAVALRKDGLDACIASTGLRVRRAVCGLCVDEMVRAAMDT